MATALVTPVTLMSMATVLTTALTTALSSATQTSSTPMVTR
jgi:hypothetical protein